MNWSIGAWRGIMAPKGTPPEIVAVLEKAMEKVVQSKDFVEFMGKGPFGILWKGSKDFAAFLEEQDRTNGQLMKEAGLAK
jgi:tripartite-type tricarboxylate transporter receptor subunit TctC